MKSRIVTLSVWTVLALVGLLSGVLITHLWDRYSQETEAMGFSGIYERYLASQAGFGDNAQAYRAMSRAGMVHEASALEEQKSNGGAYLLPQGNRELRTRLKSLIRRAAEVAHDPDPANRSWITMADLPPIP